MFDFDRYREMAALTPVREFLLDWKLARVPYPQILEELQVRFGLHYNENHLSEILAREIPQKIADAAKRDRIIADTPDDQKKRCFHCGKLLPRTSLFFSRNRTRRDGFASSCKECEKAMRIERGGQGRYDRRSKESALHEV
jgi:RNase P subunit RPR2